MARTILGPILYLDSIGATGGFPAPALHRDMLLLLTKQVLKNESHGSAQRGALSGAIVPFVGKLA